MSRDLVVHCRCGQVEGRVTGAAKATVNRIVCYCDDCQAYAHHLGRADLLDAQGGTDIVQVAPSSFSFERGMDRIACVRLGPKGLYRWHTTCCNTPVGNTLAPAVPFVGIVAGALGRDTEDRDQAVGPPLGKSQGKYTIGANPTLHAYRRGWPPVGQGAADGRLASKALQIAPLGRRPRAGLDGALPQTPRMGP
jgi:hypothetical protein